MPQSFGRSPEHLPLEPNLVASKASYAFDHFIFAFFAVEMVIKMVALGIFGQKCYLGDTWNRLDFFIVIAGMMEYSLDGHNVSLSAIRTVRVLRPLRAINRVPSMRILVTLLLDTLPMLGNIEEEVEQDVTYNLTFLHPYYRPEEGEENPFICSSHRDNGMQKCSSIPIRKEYKVECTLSMDSYNPNSYPLDFGSRNGCINWNQYYNVCRTGDYNPHNGAINFDNIGYAWIAIFQVGSFFMINLCLVVIATQFSETKQRENQLMQEQRARYLSNDSTIASFSEPGSCYEELLKYICHIFRKVKRRTLRLYNHWQNKRRKKVDPNSAAHNGQGRRSKKRITSIHHLIHHHHHHHHHHYHLSNGSPQGPRSNPEICDLELSVMKPGSQLTLPPPSPNLRGSGAPDSESVHSIYHTDCHVEGAGVKCKSSNIPAAIKFTNHSNMNYPSILPSPVGKGSLAPASKGKKMGGSSGCATPVAMDASQGWSIHIIHLHPITGLCRTTSRLSGLNVPCPLPSPQSSMLNCELQNCPYCASILEDPEFEFSESDSYESGDDNTGVYEFTQDVKHGDQRDQIQQQRNKKKKEKKPPKERNKITRLWKAFGEKLKRIVESKYFNRGIMIAILINTLSMGIEYHEQPDELTNALEISNIVFTSMFALEMVLKLLAFGIWGYIKNPYNIFDGIISDGGLSVLRTFRLLRVLKLVRFMPALRRQLVVLMKTMDNVATFCMLLMLFIFIFSILGMHLFGCKFGLKTDTGDTMPDRKNFDTLLWAIVTVFQGDANRSDTDEDKTSINFEEELEKLKELRASGKSGHRFLVGRDGHQRRAISGPSRSPPPNSNWGSRRSSWNSLGRAPSLKKKSQCGERESLLSGEGKGSTDDEAEDTKLSAAGRPPRHHRAESLDCRGALELPELLQVSGVHHPMSLSPMAVLPTDCNGKMLHVPNEFYLHMDGHKDDLLDLEEELEDSYCYRIRKAFEPYKPEWCKTHEDWSLYLFSPQNRFRANCQKVIAHKMFDHVVLVFIFLNCITIALERPDIDPNSTERVVALGFFSGEHTYLQSSWNILDGVLVFVSIIDIIVSMASAGGAKILGILRVLRLLRTLRPLRYFSAELRGALEPLTFQLWLVVETLISSLRPIGNIVLICCAFFIIFGILGVQLFKGKFYYCEGPDIRNVSTKSDCKNAHYKWVRRKYNFDNLGQALMSLFVLSSKDGWVNIMYDGLDAVGVDQQVEAKEPNCFIGETLKYLLLANFFVLNMFVGVVVENFHKCRQHQEAEEARRREEKRLRRLEKKRRKAQRRPYYADYSPVRRYIHTLCTSHYLDLFITFIIGVNVITMSMEHFNQPKSLDEALKYCNYVFTIFFVIEAVLKLVAFGFRRFFKDRWNQLDLAIVLLSIMGITLEEIEMNAALPINPTIIRIMRVLRIARVLKLLKMATGMRALLDTVVQALPQVGNLGLLFMLLFFIYAALGVELFGKLDCSEDNPCEGLSRHATFNNFGMAFLTLFRVSTGDNWNGIMKDTLRECHRDDKHCLSYLPIISPVYFVTFVLIAQFVLVNVVVAVLMKHLEESNKEAKEDAEMDAEIELEMSRGINTPVRVPESNLATPKTGSPLLVKHQALDAASSLGEPHNLLTVRKISVARMHSLPNDSYMFRPVMPAKSPYPLHEAELEAYSFKSPRGSITSVRSQPVETCSSSLRVPREAFRPATPPPDPKGQGVPWKLRPPQVPPLSPSVHRLLCRQEAIQRDSLESQRADSKDSTQTEACETLRPKKLSQSTLGPPLSHHPTPTPSLPGSPPHPHTSLHRSASVRTRKHTFNLHSLPRRPSSGESNPDSSFFESSDLADEEVSHINSSVGDWQDGVDSGDHSKSPLASPVPSPILLKNGSTTSLTAGGSKEKDLKKFYSVDTRGFLAKPTWTDDHRRHSIEICPSITDGDRGFPDSSEEKKPLPFHIHPESEYIHGVRRKKKMSPPCISIEPPMEEEKNTSTRTKASENSLLRRRTPSCESTAYRDSSELSESQLGDPGAKGERRGAPPPACRGEHLTIPNFSFEQSDAPNSTGGLSESGSAGGLPADSPPKDGVVLELQKVDHLKPQCGPPMQNHEVLGGTRSPLRKHELVPIITATTDGEVDEPV
ncbi:hypothetical protein JD844_020081 [Phrynosoma platyrhinos]|uniref:Ion transport domain-containing protein n=1 Tax=Phrynosoma platyrhinos TaxID=52577 RepID=A0ABQ7TRQ2_PHRPL|nr:hypothetical protein JD844_020081 [Phrynosoma platyrhinos]